MGSPLDTAGKRAAFALFYGPLHFLTVQAIVIALGAHARPLQMIADLGCGTGVGGAAWALACARPPSIALSPSTPSILYASTRSTDILRSADGGLTWSPPSSRSRHCFLKRHWPVPSRINDNKPTQRTDDAL